MKNKLFYNIILVVVLVACAKPKGALVSPSVDFTYAVDNANPAKYNFTNISKFVNGFVWYFGDGDSSKTVQTSHTYKNSGTYNVTLKAFTDDGIKTVIKSITVSVKIIPTANFTFSMPKPFVLVANGTFTNTSQNAISYKWNFGDGSISTLSSPTHEYTTDGTFNVRLAAYSSTGDSSIIIKQLIVKPKADSMIITKVTIVKTDTLQWGMYPYDFGSSADFLVAFGNWIDTTKKRTSTKINTVIFPIIYNLTNKPIVLPVPLANRLNVNPIYIYDGDQGYEKYGDELSLYIPDYTINPNAYPSSITIATGDGISEIILEVSWK